MSPAVPEFEAQLSLHHEEIVALFARFFAAQQPAEAAKALERVQAELRSHIQYEEDVILPEIDVRAGPAEAAQAEKLRMEHSVFRSWLDQAQHLGADGQLDACREVMKRILRGLEAHTLLDEKVLYPLTSRLVTEETRARLNAQAAVLFARKPPPRP